MALDITSAWFSYELHGGQPIASATTADMTADAGNASPVAHILDRYSFRQWQSPANVEFFEIDFGENVEIQQLTVVFPRITDPRRKNDVQEILASDEADHFLDADGGTPGTGAVFSSGRISLGVNPKRGYHVVALQTPITARYWRCKIHAFSRASEGFFLVMFADAGPIFQPSFNHIYGETLGFPDNAELQRTPTSQASFVTRNERTLTARLIWDFIPDSEVQGWKAMDEYAGTTEPVVFAIANKTPTAFVSVAGPDGWVVESENVFLGLIESELSIASRNFDANIKQIQLTEHR